MVLPSLTLGNFTILYSILLVFLQLLLLGKKADKKNLAIQIVVSFIFGYFVDFGMWIMSWLDPTLYIEQLICVIIGCFALAFGVYIQIVADLVIVPGDGFAYALTMKLRRPYTIVRTSSDVTMIIIAAIIGYAFLGTLGGVREGTIISALLVGNVAGLYMKKLGRLTEKLNPGRHEAIMRVRFGKKGTSDEDAKIPGQ